MKNSILNKTFCMTINIFNFLWNVEFVDFLSEASIFKLNSRFEMIFNFNPIKQCR